MMTSPFPPALPRPLEAATGRNHHGMAVARATPRTNAITFSILPILSVHHLMARTVADNKSIRRPSSATCVPSASLEHTTFVHICARIQTNDPLFAQSAVKPSHVSTTASAMKVFTRARRSSCAKVLYRAARAGAVDAGLLVRMPWVVISGQKQAESASNLCSTRKRPRGKRRGWKSSSRHKLQQV